MLVDTIYMVVYGAFLQFAENQTNFLQSFGFYPQKSFFVSFFLFTWLWIKSLDVPIRMALRAFTRS